MYYSHGLCESRGMTVENAKRFNITPLIVVLIMAFSYLLLYDLTAVTDYAGGAVRDKHIRPLHVGQLHIAGVSLEGGQAVYCRG